MLNTHDLEKRWLRYKIKSYIPHFIITLSLLVIGIIVINFTSTTGALKEQKQVLATETTLVQKPITQELSAQKDIITREPQRVANTPQQELHFSKNNAKVQLSPSLDFMKKMQHSSHLYYNTREAQEPIIVKPKKQPNKRPKKRIMIEQEIEEVVIQEPIVVVQKKKIQINRQNTQNDIFEIIKRFKKNNNPALSLFVAKKYYELEDYHQAYNYALITNGIDKNIESSWLIFAKSLYKLDKKAKAIKTLKEYINFSHSSGARLLLNEMKAGKFR